ncbi:hypothetical protein JIN85_18360 [Luteolibacter pohnpeiensis]|uniref:Uncharacterized protein n=1 Tax=Luteolibacter pohnpeiensis TaxID=454153 RepID=A0A934S920_9BACT|nr:hypothetical protein [Luteolibacter pohnpeiensis]MBK1884387.1 hypothetical protein [Luteolibacter pohnpeiensis]
MKGWVALCRSEETLALLEGYPNAFLLLCQIALRAKWKDCPISGLRAGEALIGDWKKAGLHSKKAYEVAKSRLEKCQLVAFQGGNKGTRAKLINSTVFSVFHEAEGEPEATPMGSQGESKGKPGGTNNKEIKKQGHTETDLFASNGTSSDSPPAAKQTIRWTFENGFEGITPEDHKRWSEAFPTVNLDSSIASASEWLRVNPAKKKKYPGRFLTNWLTRAQERGGYARTSTATGTAFTTPIAGRHPPPSPSANAAQINQYASKIKKG